MGRIQAMRRNDARAALEAAREWESKGMFKPGAFASIEKSLAVDSRETSLAMQSFFVVGGILLGAATAALYALLLVNDVFPDTQPAAWNFFLVCAAALLIAGVTTSLLAQKDLGDALLIAGMVPLGTLLGPEIMGDQEILRAIPVLGALGIVAFRRAGHLVPALALGLATAALPIFLYRLLEGSDGSEAATSAWLAGAVAAWAGMAAWNHFDRIPWRHEGAVLTTLGAAAAWIATTIDIIQPSFDGGYELLLGIGFSVLLGTGILLKQPGIVFAAAAALTVDVIVFAFQFGGPTVGLLTLLGLAAALITTAILLRRRKAATL